MKQRYLQNMKNGLKINNTKDRLQTIAYFKTFVF